MPGNEQFSSAVRSATASELSVTVGDTVETDNYATGDAFDLAGGESLNPADVIQELIVTDVPSSDLVISITTTGGDTFDFPHRGGTFTLDKLEIDSVDIGDPSGTGESVTGVWAGE